MALLDILSKVESDLDALFTSTGRVFEYWNDNVSKSLDEKVIAKIKSIADDFTAEATNGIRMIDENQNELESLRSIILNEEKKLKSLLSECEACMVTVSIINEEDGVADYYDNSYKRIGRSVTHNGRTEFYDSQNGMRRIGTSVAKDGRTEYYDPQSGMKRVGTSVSNNGRTEFYDPQSGMKRVGTSVSNNGRTEFYDPQSGMKRVGTSVSNNGQINYYDPQSGMKRTGTISKKK